MANTITLEELKVDLQQLSDAADSIQGQATTIQEQCNEITQAFQLVAAPDVWSSPAGATFVDLETACTTALNNLNALLVEMISRMRAAYQNYHDAEEANFKNFNGGR
jgi:WXG100 family type VII secretion target